MRQATARPARLPRRRRISADARRESILQTASLAFAERGYDGVRTQDLAAEAGISEALIYQHFVTKAELYLEVMRRASDALQERLEEASAPGPSVEERLERGLEAFIEFLAERSNAWPTLTQQVSDPEIATYQRELRQRAIGTLADLLALDPRAKRAGLKRRQLDQLAEIIAGGAEALAAWWANNPRAKRSELVGLLAGFVGSGLGQMQKGTRRR